MKPLLAILIVTAVFVAAVCLVGARPGPVLSLSGVGVERSCSYNTTQGNTSSWNVAFNITNRGASGSAAVSITVDGAGIVYEHDFVPASATVAFRRVVTDPAIPTDPACLPHDVTVAILGYVL